MSGHTKPRPAPTMDSADVGRRMHAHIKANHRAGDAVRACTARHRPDLPANVHKVALSDAPIGLAEVVRLVADLRHYCALTALSWRLIDLESGHLFNKEKPPGVKA